jgi:5-hydroxyisourate hydrolase-like protein (transthyretin family)
MRKFFVLIQCLLLTAVALGQKTKPFTCTVKVVDYNARPIADAEVAVYEKLYNYSSGEEYAKLLGRIKKTDVEGCCVLNVDIGSQRDVFIVARKKELALGWDILNPGSSYNAKGNILIILEKPGTLAGTLVDEAGEAVIGAKIQAIPKTSYLSRLRQRPILAPEQWFITQTDTRGNFSFNNFAADVNADFWVKAPGRASVYKYTTCYLSGCGFEVGRTDIRLVLPSEGTAQGHVVDAESGNPVANVELLLRPDNIREHLNPYCPRNASSGQDGKFSFQGIPIGKHILEVVSPEKEFAEWVGRIVKLELGKSKVVDDIVVEVGKGGIIEVVVREEATKKPLQNIRVSAYSESSSGQGWTNSDGLARIRVPADEFNIYRSAPDYSYYRSDNLIAVTKGQTTKLEILLDRKTGTSGTVLDESGQPVAGALVRAHPFGDEVITDTNGRFEIGFDQRRPAQYLFARHTESNLAAIVSAKDSEPIKISLKPALSISGQVTDANGVWIPAARLSLCVNVTNCLSVFGPELLADENGRYEIKAVPPQKEGFNYRISVFAAGYGPKEYKRISITGEPGTPVEMNTLVLQPADQSISGIVVDAEGKPAAGVPIFLHGFGGMDQPDKSTATDNNGRFTINRICKGQLRLQASFSSSPGGAGFIKAEGGDRNVKIILGQEGVHRPHVSLLDKPLPDLKDFKIGIPSADADDKMILACFFDMEQRPSRNCIMRLAKQAQQLNQKCLSVIVVQASKVDENKLNEWVKKYKIPFAVGMVQGEGEQTRFTWGVRSLPWLILTDKEHIVRAEDFAISELDGKIKQIVP